MEKYYILLTAIIPSNENLYKTTIDIASKKFRKHKINHHNTTITVHNIDIRDSNLFEKGLRVIIIYGRKERQYYMYVVCYSLFYFGLCIQMKHTFLNGIKLSNNYIFY